MSEETTITAKPEAEPSANGSSAILGVSVRAWLALVPVFTVCVMASCGNKVEEPLYSLAIGGAGYYFGQNLKKP